MGGAASSSSGGNDYGANAARARGVGKQGAGDVGEGIQRGLDSTNRSSLSRNEQSTYDRASAEANRQSGSASNPNDIRGGAEAGQGVTIRVGPDGIQIAPPEAPSPATPAPEPTITPPKGNEAAGPATDAVASSNGQTRERRGTLLTIDVAPVTRKTLLGL